MTRAQLVLARQEPNEDILKWRSRIRSLWMRAHPAQMVAESEESRDLIDLFLKGLVRETTNTQTWAFLPCTLTAAAQRAQNIGWSPHIRDPQQWIFLQCECHARPEEHMPGLLKARTHPERLPDVEGLQG